MTRLHRVITVAAPVSDVFAVFADFRTLPSWDPGSVDCVQTRGDGAGVGAEYTASVVFNGSTSDMAYRTSVMEANARVVFEGESKLVTAVDDIRFDEVDGKTVVDYNAEIKLKGFRALFTPFIWGALDKLADAAAEGIAHRFSDAYDERETDERRRKHREAAEQGEEGKKKKKEKKNKDDM